MLHLNLANFGMSCSLPAVAQQLAALPKLHALVLSPGNAFTVRAAGRPNALWSSVHLVAASHPSHPLPTGLPLARVYRATWAPRCSRCRGCPRWRCYRS